MCPHRLPAGEGRERGEIGVNGKRLFSCTSIGLQGKIELPPILDLALFPLVKSGEGEQKHIKPWSERGEIWAAPKLATASLSVL